MNALLALYLIISFVVGATTIARYERLDAYTGMFGYTESRSALDAAPVGLLDIVFLPSLIMLLIYSLIKRH